MHLPKIWRKITFTPIFIEAVVKAIKDLPLVNVGWGYKDHCVKKINIGMAAALPTGNLIVPVIKMPIFNLAGLTKSVNDLARQARQNKLKPEEIQDGTFTLTNVGTLATWWAHRSSTNPRRPFWQLGPLLKTCCTWNRTRGCDCHSTHDVFVFVVRPPHRRWFTGRRLPKAHLWLSGGL